MNRKKTREIFLRFRKATIKPTTELNYSSPFELLIAVILSAQATDISVNKATEQLFKIANTPEQLVSLGTARLSNYIKSIGLYKTKAKNIINTCGLLIKKHHSAVPHERVFLEELPGVGRKTANVILNTCFNQPVIAVDTHIFRVSQRIGLAKGTTPLIIEQQLIKKIPEEFLHDAHHWLILHGRYTCIARRPRCAECLINDLCEYSEKTAN